MGDPRLGPARRAASVVRAWLTAYHCLGGEQFRLGPKESAIVVVADFAGEGAERKRERPSPPHCLKSRALLPGAAGEPVQVQ